MDENPDLLTVQEVAEMLGMSKMTIYRLVEIGEIPCLRIRHSIRIRRVEVENRTIPEAGRPHDG